MTSLADITYTDVPMKCCGMGMGSGFSENVKHPLEKPNSWGDKFVYKYFTKEDTEHRLTLLIKETQDHGRNCAMIVLSADQSSIKEAAEAKGFKVIQQFYNPNSGNQCYIMTYVHFDSFEDYKAKSGWGGEEEVEDD